MSVKLGVSMDVRARYKGQGSFYERGHVGKQLSNRKITEYIKKGFYGGSKMRRQNLLDRLNNIIDKTNEEKKRDILRNLLS
jgi:hypothetical protein